MKSFFPQLITGNLNSLQVELLAAKQVSTLSRYTLHWNYNPGPAFIEIAFLSLLVPTYHPQFILSIRVIHTAKGHSSSNAKGGGQLDGR